MTPDGAVARGPSAGRCRSRLTFIASALVALGLAAPVLASPASAQPVTPGQRVITNVPLGISATAVAVDPVTDTVYVAGGHTIAVVNGKTNTLVTKIQAGTKLAAIAVDPVTGRTRRLA
jgi:DNA-binding beta-propeller fold protein YncE